jgi:hypothetical protein
MDVQQRNDEARTAFGGRRGSSLESHSAGGFRLAKDDYQPESPDVQPD